MSERIPAVHTGNCPVSYFLLVLMTPSLDLELKTGSQAELPKKKKKKVEPWTREGGAEWRGEQEKGERREGQQSAFLFVRTGV